MLKSKNQKKSKINVLLNVSDYYGRHSSNQNRVLLFVVIIAIPFLIYSLLLVGILSFKFFLIFYIPFVIKTFLVVVGREKERLESYINRRNDKYGSAKNIFSNSSIHDDGLIEYPNGSIGYIISTYGYSYFEDNAYSKDVEDFLTKLLVSYEVDIYCHMVVNELGLTQNEREKLKIYAKGFLQERLDFYNYQKEYSNKYTKLYRMNFCVMAPKSQWATLKKDVEELVKSDLSNCFDIIYVCDKDDVTDVASRDLCLHIDIIEMLKDNLSSDKFFGSKVLYFGEKKEEEKDSKHLFEEEEGRRIID